MTAREHVGLPREPGTRNPELGSFLLRIAPRDVAVGQAPLELPGDALAPERIA